MYNALTEVSRIVSGPISSFLHSYEHSPIIVAILLGLIGALAPCQLTGNMSAITLYGSRTIQIKENWHEVVYFIVGKVIVFSMIGFLAWMFGRSIETEMTSYFQIFRKVMGPLLIVTGLVLAGILKLHLLDYVTSRMPVVLRGGRIGSLLLGASFALAFCPTMFVLFFVWLMPIVMSTTYGLLLPSVFGIATSVPLIVIIVLIWYFDAQRLIMKKSKQIGKIVQTIAGIILILIGVLDTVTYW